MAGTNNGSKVVALVVLSLLLHSHNTQAATHLVGDSQGGWGFSVSYDSWTTSKTFTAGDTLIFNYQQGLHNVVPVSASGYRNCRASDVSKAGTSGNDKYTLKRGSNYFICSFAGHCSAGMKILVVAK
ncbi:hypothetical protein LUZ60_012249 [Juncus effusus]|nr:hypothetical protein LUZ60_012249 [Juncus effusus]